MRKVCIITGTRAEYGLLRWVMQGIEDASELELQVIASGMHLSPEFGLTYQDIEQDGFQIDRKVEMLTSSDTAVGIAKSMGLGLIGFADALNELHPDLIVVLGDRFEILAAVAAALCARIPVLHLHGGEVTEGALDESMRHAITKMSHVHCVATEEYRQRVIQLGEQPERVHCVGGLGVDAIRRIRLMDRDELEAALDFKFRDKNLLVTFHPATLAGESTESQMSALLAALDELSDTGLIFTLPNADAGGRELIAMLQTFVATHPNARAYPSLGQLRYLSCMALCDGVVGNSSSGLLEAPTLKKGTVNIGERQRGRLQAANVINCTAERKQIAAALKQLYSPAFQARLVKVSNPYGDGGASMRVIAIIKALQLDGLIQKPFYDLPAAVDLEPGANW
ncbi:MAG: UDP-N-acetylglucosamine 2-epimerase (hydrolyzing) [Proteobacteria bacterium]|nr:UDP-N-acetylglucosamine 2-epimerase (hydrolyzing) [Pseudomonadota bacterium]